jgi:predicted nucleic acid-binding Zn ribbon protein
MDSAEQRQLEAVCDDIRRRQRFGRTAKPLSDLISSLMARRGYAQVQAGQTREAAWAVAAGNDLAGHSRPGNVRGGVLEVFVRNSTVLQELTFQKRRVLERFNQHAPDQQVRELRFRVGTIE